MMRATMIRNTVSLGAVAAAATASATGATVTPIQRVVSLMADMKAKAVEEKQKEIVTYEGFTSWCSGTQEGFNAKIADLSDTIAKANADMNLQDAIMKEQEKIAAENAQREADATSDKKKLFQMRDFLKNDFGITSKDYLESISALKRAHDVLHANFNSNTVESLDAFLQKESFLSFLTPRAHSALLQVAESQKDPQAAEYAYTPKSGDILDMVANLQANFKSELSDLTTSWKTQQGSIDQSTQALTGQVELSQRTQSDAKTQRAEANEAYGEAQGLKAEKEEQKTQEEKALADVTTRCKDASEEFPVRQQTRAGEIEALSKAIDVMSGSTVGAGSDNWTPNVASSLMQLNAQLHGDLSPQAKNQVVSMFRNSGISGLLSLANTVEVSGTFDKVKDLIQNMIYKLTDQAQKEAAQHGFCETELSKNKINMEGAKESVEKESLRKEKLEVKVAQLLDDVSDLKISIQENNAALTAATAGRAQEKTENDQTMIEAKEALDAVSGARVVLEEFYNSQGGFSFAQKSQQQPLSADFDKGANPFTSDPVTVSSGNNPLNFLTIIESDFTDLYSETKSDEEIAVREFNTYQQDTKKLIASQAATKAGKEQAVAATKSDLQFTTEQLGNAQEAEAAAKEVYEKLKPTCVSNGVSYEERMAAREKEMEQLQNALEILTSNQ